MRETTCRMLKKDEVVIRSCQKTDFLFLQKSNDLMNQKHFMRRLQRSFLNPVPRITSSFTKSKEGQQLLEKNTAVDCEMFESLDSPTCEVSICMYHSHTFTPTGHTEYKSIVEKLRAP